MARDKLVLAQAVLEQAQQPPTAAEEAPTLKAAPAGAHGLPRPIAAALPSGKAPPEVFELLGRGSYGTVWRGYDAEFGAVAVKIVPLALDADEPVEGELAEEIELLRAASHANVIASQPTAATQRQLLTALRTGPRPPRTPSLGPPPRRWWLSTAPSSRRASRRSGC